MNKDNKYDIVVIGGGHAGIEAAAIAAKMKCKTALLTMDFKTIGVPSCNPSIGGTAKGHLVKEIDALGGAMGFLADQAGIHFKMLNISKGPAIWSPRCQIDKDLYPQVALKYLQSLKYLDLVEGLVKEVKLIKKKIYSIICNNGTELTAKSLIICSGTFLNGKMFTGRDVSVGGRFGEQSSENLSDLLENYGIKRGRLKTGTPPRISAESIDYGRLDIQAGDMNPAPFSYLSNKVENKVLCFQTETNEDVHTELRKGFGDSPMFNGIIKGIGPRYCPSIEDKINRFADRDGHKIILEPEGLNTNSVYVNGFSTSLPKEVQINALRKIRGLKKCEILRYGYAIEYDFFYPYQLKYTLESKILPNLYFAGQINGTSGYEEAACQGLIAGINAAAKIKKLDDLVLKRSDAYIGVLIDDLVNKSTEEPYRIFTSSAEYRLLLRQDNAKYRLCDYAMKYKLIPKERYNQLKSEQNIIEESLFETKNIKIKADDINSYFIQIGETTLIDSTDINTLSKRPGVSLEHLINMTNAKPKSLSSIIKNKELLNILNIEIKYEGYINRQKKEIERFLHNEEKRIPVNFEYNSLSSLSNEAREKLMKIKPESLGQASRISGVTSSDISVIALFLR
ncbi:MAG: tRNA uridine-5-carboxymethylaminomethyl(34) synthesis enzyme MnmG [Candidatus Kapabacteria bacterium]|nr:tRNA uridine-5-carboxymethylaminomethyl(34) synthesis enzyme MnmG [Candidatus Kapabacteria bacterium]